MNVVITAEQLRRPVPGGIGTYVRGLAQGLSEMGADSPSARFFEGRLPAQLLTRAWDRGWLSVPGGDGLVHATSLAVPWRGGGPRVVSIHDSAWRVVPEAFTTRGREWHEAALQRALVRAAAVVVPSAATAAAIGSGSSTLFVIEPGCDHLPLPDDVSARAVLAGLGVEGPYILSVSTLEPRKNLPRLFSAYAMTRPELPSPWPLVVVGPTGWGQALAPVQGVVMAGQVPAAVLAALYGGARCVAYVPLVEGFGLPAVEAMLAGVPVVASPMPSTAGAALEVDPLDVPAIASGLLQACLDEEIRTRLVSAGNQRAAPLRWEGVARAHTRVWQGVL